MCQALKTQVRVLLSSVQQFINKLPAAKQESNKLAMQQMIKKYNPENKEELMRLQKDLQFKINFLKLAYPGLVSVQSESNETMAQKGEEILQQHQEQEGGEAQRSQDSLNANQKESDSIESGTYVMKDGKLVKGEAERRELVDWSNWFAANVDPEDLKKHKELMDRQHFGGPVWKGKGRPMSIIDEVDPVYAPGVKELNPYLKQEKEAVFEKVKR